MDIFLTYVVLCSLFSWLKENFLCFILQFSKEISQILLMWMKLSNYCSQVCLTVNPSSGKVNIIISLNYFFGINLQILSKYSLEHQPHCLISWKTSWWRIFWTSSSAKVIIVSLLVSPQKLSRWNSYDPLTNSWLYHCAHSIIIFYAFEHYELWKIVCNLRCKCADWNFITFQGHSTLYRQIFVLFQWYVSDLIC